ncbi:hypothetical protein PSTT_08162 [Puccinia striiformis]|uniref:Uncharacterized protein n=1 Tax=Puccinia striiformis TaxID=27350 RepID=A0A2S4VDL2_9BASI|nr:hypothetical protein PSTT_08162 [Puccinia striiformis]
MTYGHTSRSWRSGGSCQHLQQLRRADRGGSHSARASNCDPSRQPVAYGICPTVTQRTSVPQTVSKSARNDTAQGADAAIFMTAGSDQSRRD